MDSTRKYKKKNKHNKKGEDKGKEKNEDKIVENLLKIHNFKYDSILGKGGFGNVFSIYVNDNNFAFKVVKLNKNVKDNEDKTHLSNTIKLIETEFSYAKMLRSKYCIRTLSIYKDENDKLFKNLIIYSAVMDKASYSDLKYFVYYFYKGNLLHLNNNHNFPFNKNINIMIIRFFAYQMIQSLDFLFSHNLCHCDFKSENFLICYGFNLKISDFSLIKIIEKNKNVKLTSSTWNIRPLEYFTENKEVSSEDAIKIDIYGFGLILYYMIFHEHLLNNNDDKDILTKKELSRENKYKHLQDQIIKKRQKIKDSNIEKGLKDLILSSIELFPSKRPNVKDLLENNWVNEDMDILKQIYNINDYEEIKLFIEFQKFKKNDNIKKRKRRKNNFYYNDNKKKV